MNKELYNNLVNEYNLLNFYQVRNHVAALTFSDDPYMRFTAKCLYKALKRRGPWKSS